MPKYNKAVANFWVKHYLNEKGHCALCNNHGTFDVHRELKGRCSSDWETDMFYCFCPNGQVLRRVETR